MTEGKGDLARELIALTQGEVVGLVVPCHEEVVGHHILHIHLKPIGRDIAHHTRRIEGEEGVTGLIVLIEHRCGGRPRAITAEGVNTVADIGIGDIATAIDGSLLGPHIDAYLITLGEGGCGLGERTAVTGLRTEGLTARGALDGGIDNDDVAVDRCPTLPLIIGTGDSEQRSKE